MMMRLDENIPKEMGKVKKEEEYDDFKLITKIIF